MYSIEIWRGGEKLAEARGENEAALLYRGAYEAGDEIRFSSDSQHAVVQVDQQVKPARVYLPPKAFVYRPPLAGDGLAVYPPRAFAGDMHLISIKPDAGSEYRNLAGIDGPQRVELGSHRTRTLTLDRLIKCDNPSAFPALRQIEVYGR